MLMGTVVVLLAVATFQIGCLDEIELPAPEGVEEAFVIQGSIVKGDPSTIRVSVTRLFDFTGGSLTPVNVLLAEVEDENGVKLKLPEIAPGLYGVDLPKGSPDFEVEFGKSYKLHVAARDGREYFTGYEALLPVPVADSTSYDVVEVEVFDEEGNIELKEKVRVVVHTTTDVPGQEKRARLKWDVERTYKLTDTPLQPTDSSKTCYLTENVVGNNVLVVDGNDRTTDRVDNFPVYESSVTSAFAEGMYVTVYQQALTEGAAQYWEEVKLLVERTGNMFEPPAGEVSTNLSNPADDDDKVYGYFYCYAQDTLRQYISPESVGSPNDACPPPGGLLTEDGRCAAPVCCDCFSHPNSTIDKPEYWTE